MLLLANAQHAGTSISNSNDCRIELRFSCWPWWMIKTRSYGRKELQLCIYLVMLFKFRFKMIWWWRSKDLLHGGGFNHLNRGIGKKCSREIKMNMCNKKGDLCYCFVKNRYICRENSSNVSFTCATFSVEPFYNSSNGKAGLKSCYYEFIHNR